MISQHAGVNRYSLKHTNINEYTANKKSDCHKNLSFMDNTPTSKNEPYYADKEKDRNQ